MSDFNYQKEAARTLIFEPDREIPFSELQAARNIVSLFIPVGSLAEYIKKGVFHQRGLEYSVVEKYLDYIPNSFWGHISPNFKLTGRQIMILWVLTGLIGEVGEISQLIFGYLFLGKELDKEELIKEFGDSAWYWSCLLTLFDLDMDEVLRDNIKKLEKRYPKGYNATDSKLRKDLQ
jgi:NTP pyrophosphatase (non-canonical NTP hydrolase)